MMREIALLSMLAAAPVWAADAPAPGVPQQQAAQRQQAPRRVVVKPMTLTAAAWKDGGVIPAPRRK